MAFSGNKAWDNHWYCLEGCICGKELKLKYDLDMFILKFLSNVKTWDVNWIKGFRC